MSFDPIKQIRNTNDVKFLEEMLSKWLPMDYHNIKKNDFEFESKLWGTTPDEFRAGRIKGYNQIKQEVEKRLAQLMSK